jgi:hypothetical protein
VTGVTPVRQSRTPLVRAAAARQRTTGVVAAGRPLQLC